MKIIELKAENFKRLRAVHIRPDGALQQITGRNAQGKSSVLDAVWAALAGKAASPARPVRDGEKRARVSVDLGEFVVTRKWTADGNSTLSVESKDGATFRSPQAMLDKLVASLTFDPLAFTRSSPGNQAQILRAIAGINTAEIDARRARAFEERTDVNRDLKAAAARLDGMPEVDGAAEPVSVAALLEELRAAEMLGEERDAVEEAVQTAERALAMARAEEVAAQQALEKAKNATDAAQRSLAERRAAADERLSVVDPDPLEIRDRIAGAEAQNERARQRAAREKQAQVVAELEAKALDLGGKIAACDREKADALAAARFPVPGLSVDDDGPTFNGVPLSQASAAEQLRVSLAVAAAANPKLRTVLVRDGSLLDQDGLATVAAWAEEHDMQVLMERVADGTNVGIVIEDGTVVDAGGMPHAPTAAELEQDAFPIGGES